MILYYQNVATEKLPHQNISSKRNLEILQFFLIVKTKKILS